MNHLEDNFGRRFSYLRLSITDACNFRCQYCLPNSYKKTTKEPYLSVDEIRRLVTAFTELGLWKIRLTGGEPTLRREFEEISHTISQIPGIKKIAFTTNGYRLARCAKSFYDAGLRAVNVSVDSLSPETFYKITGQNKLQLVLDGLQAAKEVGFESIKINVVLLKHFNSHNFNQSSSSEAEFLPQLNEFLNFIRNKNYDVRFIELMQTLENKAYFEKYHISATNIREKLMAQNWQLKAREIGDGPAEIWQHEEFAGRVGLIAPYSKDFCTTCNRLRVNSLGYLRLCLFGEGGIYLRPLLQHDSQKEELKTLIIKSLPVKKISHNLLHGDTGDTPHFASIGG